MNLANQNNKPKIFNDYMMNKHSWSKLKLNTTIKNCNLIVTLQVEQDQEMQSSGNKLYLCQIRYLQFNVR